MNRSDPYCLIGGLAVNCYVDPVYTLDADLVVVSTNLGTLSGHLLQDGFAVEPHPPSVNLQALGSDLRIQFTTDARCQAFLPRSRDMQVLGVHTKVACVEDVAHGKLWAYSDPQRRLSKRKKNELDLIRLAEAFPDLKSFYPKDLLDQLAAG